MTNQDFFTKAVTHTLNQKEQCVNEYGTCLYAGPNGAACAVGCMIPRELVEDTTLNDEDLYTLLRKSPEIKALFAGVSEPLMRQCQLVHDDVRGRTEEDLDELRALFAKVAKDYELEMPNV